MISRLVFASVGLGLLAACSTLPAGGPSTREIVSSRHALAYQLVDVDENVTALLVGRKEPTLEGRFGTRGGGGSEVIGVGDTLSVVIWEAAAGGLFSGASGDIGGGSKVANIPAQPVARNGTITVPYAGQVRVVGRTPQEVQATIVGALTGKAIEPQALVTVSTSLSNAVTLTGDVTRGGRIPLSTRGDKILDVISAGGFSGAVSDVYVQLTRGKTQVGVPLQVILDNPSENIPLRPDDIITLTNKPQTFLALGATGRNAQVPLGAISVPLSDAVGKIGGLDSERADPAGVFVYRREPRATLAAIAPGSEILAQPGEMLPVIYRVNLRDARGLFLAKEFRIYNGDIVYVTSAPLNELRKFLSLVSTVVQPVSTANNLSQSFSN